MLQRKARMVWTAAAIVAALGVGIFLGRVVLAAGPARAPRVSAVPAGAPVQARRAAQGLDAPHRALGKLAGNYGRVVRFLGQAGAAAAPSYGTATFSVALGGRFILERSHDVVFGRPVDGLRIYGYNDVTRQYEMARMYTMSTAITFMKGAASDAGRTIEYAGETPGPGGRNVPLQARLHWENPGRFTVTMAMVGPGGKLTPFQETTYTRKK